MAFIGSFFKPTPPPPPPVQPKITPPAPPPPRPPAASSGASSFQAAPAKPQVALDSTLRTEVLNDGKAGCLERAAQLARPGDSVLLMNEQGDPVGHALVQHQDGSVTDPNQPTVRYPDLG